MIEPANDTDLAEILSWLKADYDLSGAGFYCNRGWIERAHDEGNLFIVRHEGNVAGFMAASSEIYEILEVRSQYRGMGFGRALAEFCIERSRAADVSVIEIECAPITSVPFWKKFDFHLLAGSDCQARLVLEKTFDLPADLEKIGALVEFYAESAGYQTDVQPLSRHSLLAVRVADEYIQFDRRIIAPSDGNVFMRILIDGEQLYCGKLKYRETQALGVQRRHFASHIDGIRTSALAN